MLGETVLDSEVFLKIFGEELEVFVYLTREMRHFLRVLFHFYSLLELDLGLELLGVKGLFVRLKVFLDCGQRVLGISPLVC